MESDPSLVSCDLCGRHLRRAHPMGARLSYCSGCERFVCPLCWIPGRESCSACMQPNVDVIDRPRAAIGATFERSSVVERRRRPSPPVPAAPAPEVNRGHPPRPGNRWATGVIGLLLLAAGVAFVNLEPWNGLGPGEGRAGSPVDSDPVRDAVLGGTPSPAGPVVTPAAIVQHTVVPGDTLRGLADRFYGDEERWLEIFEANRAVIAVPDQLNVGSVLEIPDPGP